MSSLGDEPLNRKRKRRTAAQADAEQAQLTQRARNVEYKTTIYSELPVPVQTLIPHTTASPLKALGELLRLIDGVAWLRIVPDHDNQVTHWYIKYNKGRWNGYYIYYGQGFGDDELDAVEFCIIRFGEVAAGTRKPHKDTRYSG